MKCPECNISHNKLEKTEICQHHLDNEWAFYVIICNPLKSDYFLKRITEERLKEFPPLSGPHGLDDFRKLKKKRESMKKYISTF
ncbi:MAG TPA: hypothetical protein ENH82_14565 [bacterium]|nr:hypothetical protein [bacterium]